MVSESGTFTPGKIRLALVKREGIHDMEQDIHSPQADANVVTWSHANYGAEKWVNFRPEFSNDLSSWDCGLRLWFEDVFFTDPPYNTDPVFDMGSGNLGHYPTFINNNPGADLGSPFGMSQHVWLYFSDFGTEPNPDGNTRTLWRIAVETDK